MLRVELVSLSGALLGSGILLIVVKIVSGILFSPLKSIPGPLYSRFTNLPLKWSVITGQRIHYVQKLHEQYGSIVRISPDEVAVADFDSCRKIHKVGSGFLKTEWYAKLNSSPRDGVFVMRDPKEHAARRKLFARPFSKTALRSQWEPIVAKKARLAIAGILKDVYNVGSADILKWFTFMATDTSGHLMFGESFRMLESGKKNQYIEILESALMGGGIGAEFPYLVPILKRIPLKSTQQLFNANQYLWDYAARAIHNSKISGTTTHIFSTMMSEAEKDNGSLDDLDVQLEAGNLIVAGSDTTAITLTYTVWAVLQNSQLRQNLEVELDASSSPELFSDASLEALPLLNSTIEEALRLYGAAPGALPRSVPSSGAMLAGHFIPGGAVVSTQSWTLHRDPKIFKNPDKFDPYRFMPYFSKVTSTPTTFTTQTDSTADTSALSPFGTGSRTCLGIHLAYMELRYGLAYFLKECRSIRLSPEMTDEMMQPENFFLIAPKAHKCMVVE